ncbi:MAG: TetR/AcrR family transcriptional regulator [Burkholderiales bacterium]|nr:MAG: TetR/AcrR family transcriptional regulator [Burkholderiales bacterium]
MKKIKIKPLEAPKMTASESGDRASPTSGEAKADGRADRSRATRKQIVQALTALVYEGHLAPTAQQVAKRAGIGLRTVFRHFEDMDSLYREISTNLDALMQPVLLQRLSAPTWQERLLESIDHRADLFDRMAAMHVAAQAHRHESAYLAGNLMDVARLQRELLMRLLPPAQAKNALLLDALDVMMSIEAWIRLRREQGLASDQAREVVRLGVRALLGNA